MAIQITIPITPVTKKNHQQIMRSSKTGKPFVMPSAEYRQYEAQAVWHCKRAAISAGVHKPIDTPCEVRCLFYMPSRRRVDLTNLLESADDALVAAGVLADDNSQIIVSHDGSRVLYDKDSPRTEVTISPYE